MKFSRSDHFLDRKVEIVEGFLVFVDRFVGDNLSVINTIISIILIKIKLNTNKRNKTKKIWMENEDCFWLRIKGKSVSLRNQNHLASFWVNLSSAKHLSDSLEFLLLTYNYRETYFPIKLIVQAL